MVATDLTRCDDGDRDPCGIASWNDVRYFNAVFQSFAKLGLGITHFRNCGSLYTRLDVTSTSEVDKPVQEPDWRPIDLALDFVRIVKPTKQGLASVVRPITCKLS